MRKSGERVESVMKVGMCGSKLRFENGERDLYESRKCGKRVGCVAREWGVGCERRLVRK